MLLAISTISRMITNHGSKKKEFDFARCIAWQGFIVAYMGYLVQP